MRGNHNDGVIEQRTSNCTSLAFKWLLTGNCDFITATGGFGFFLESPQLHITLLTRAMEAATSSVSNFAHWQRVNAAAGAQRATETRAPIKIWARKEVVACSSTQKEINCPNCHCAQHHFAHYRTRRRRGEKGKCCGAQTAVNAIVLTSATHCYQIQWQKPFFSFL